MRDETVLCIAPRAWRSLWRDTQQIMSRIAKQNRVIYFEPGRNPDRRHSAEMLRNLPHFFRLRSRAIDDNLVIIPAPSCLPIMRQHLPHSLLQHTTPLVARTNARILIRHIQKTIEILHVDEPILWLYSPYHSDLVGRFGEKTSLYYNYDEFPDFAQNARIKELLREKDARLCSLVNIVVSTSQSQFHKRIRYNPNTYFVPNGVDFDMFHQALVCDQPQPADITSLPRPIIGFAGWLGYHIDCALLNQIAHAYPDSSLVLVGPDDLPNTQERQQLVKRANVHFLGAKARTELPRYVRAFDVALMPYSLNGHVLSSYPLKLHEYLAVGRPVVSVNLPELKPYGKVVRTAATRNAFVKEIGMALHGERPQDPEDRVAVARENTWDKRIEQLYRILDEHLYQLDKG